MYNYIQTVYCEDVAVNLANSLEYERESDWKHDPFSKLYNLIDLVYPNKVNALFSLLQYYVTLIRAFADRRRSCVFYITKIEVNLDERLSKL